MSGTRYVAFLRAINVGGRTVKMAQLKTVFEQMGLHEVSTFIASGNVIFTSSQRPSALADDVERGLNSALGYEVVTMLRSVNEVAEVGQCEPFPARVLAAGGLHVGFMRRAASPAAVQRALAMQSAVDSLNVIGREIYWLARNNIAEATLTGAAIERALATPVTFRNINTVRRLADRYLPR